MQENSVGFFSYRDNSGVSFPDLRPVKIGGILANVSKYDYIESKLEKQRSKSVAVRTRMNQWGGNQISQMVERFRFEGIPESLDN